jgi:hypothetical protein
MAVDTFHLNGQSYRVWRNKGGYACIARTDQGYPQAVLLHRLVWQLAHGPVPPGHEIHHLDYDKANWRLHNLLAVDRPTHRALHGRGGRLTGIFQDAGSRGVQLRATA